MQQRRYRRRKRGLWDYQHVARGRYERSRAGRRRHWRLIPWEEL